MIPRRRLFVLAAAAVAALAILVALDRHPITSRALPDEEELPGEMPQGADLADVMLAVDSGVIAESAKGRSFSKLDLSFGWLAPLQAEFGPVAIVDLAKAERGRLPRALVVSASAQSRAFDLAQLTLDAGGTVFVDALAGDDAVAGKWLERTGLMLDSAPESLLDLGVDGFEPIAVFERRVSRGRVIATRTDVGRTFATVLQGLPEDDFSVRERHGDYPGIVEPDDLVRDSKLRENERPFTDELAHEVASLLDPADGPPIPRVLWFPAGSRGVYLMTHDEDLRGGAAMLALAERDRELGLRGTHFIVGHPRIEGGPSDWPRAESYRGQIGDLGGCFGIHWNQMPTPRGVWKLEPIQWVATLEGQFEWYEPMFGACASAPRHGPINRNHFLILRPHWSSTFRIMTAQGIELDSTLSSNKGRGYLFGTARPYPLLDDNGLPLSVRELPFQNQEDWGGADAAYFDRLFAANSERHHGAIVSIFHPPSVLRTPTDPALVEHVARTALATGHVSRTMQEYLGFWMDRIRSGVSSEVSENGSLRVKTRTASHFPPTLGLPLRDGERVASATIAGAALALESVAIHGRNYAVIALPNGEAEIDVLFTRD